MDDILSEQFDDFGADHLIRICPTDFRQPAICRVNRQLREDTLKMFYTNAFDIEIHDLQFGPHAGHFVRTLNPYMVLQGKYSWKNFKHWLYLYFNDRSIAKITCEGGQWGYDWTNAEAKCAPAFEMVAKLADAGVAWDVIAETLEVFKDATGGPTGLGDRYKGLWAFWDS